MCTIPTFHLANTTAFGDFYCLILKSSIKSKYCISHKFPYFIRTDID